MKRTAILILVATLALVSGWTTGVQAGNGNGDGTGNCGGLLVIIGGLPLEEIDAAELTDLTWMREEEKLARDVYAAMDELWGMRIFGQIKWAEQNHMDAMFALFEKYDLADPVGDNPPGVFTDPALQALFDQLLDQGSQSLVAALGVGATIEDLDIFDLDGALANADNVDIRTVYQNLQKGSRNHLRSFVSVLQRNGSSYTPQYLPQAEYDEIISSPMEHGMLDADGEPVDCIFGGGGGQGPGLQNHPRHKQQQQNETHVGLGGR